ncbi:Hpt domain protein [Sedimentisphaera cyanobacteriorum]|uniref:Hpt domain protein n=1 Tax=Sedimentisphaera cyanobacteriorum TaxID=1940790 RepID=A0A1Q2HLI8_9BACT|nr:Hpt domain-containing protein [Sedimentisphaera cyanobacteriorum]AQQ08338.1 Hpt domain protein [Sedimentisphaera cyanobacteriorum]
MGYTESSLVSLDSLSEFCASPEVVEELVDVFVEDGKYCLDKIEEGLAGKDCGQVCLYAHRIKGSARYIAADKLAQAALNLENASKQTPCTDLSGFFNELKKAFSNVVDYFDNSDWKSQIKN